MENENNFSCLLCRPNALSAYFAQIQKQTSENNAGSFVGILASFMLPCTLTFRPNAHPRADFNKSRETARRPFPHWDYKLTVQYLQQTNNQDTIPTWPYNFLNSCWDHAGIATSPQWLADCFPSSCKL